AFFPLSGVEVIELGRGVETFQYETDTSAVGTCRVTLYGITMHPKRHPETWIAVLGWIFRVVQRGFVDTFTVDTLVGIGQQLRGVTSGLTIVTGNLSETDIVEVSGSLVGIHQFKKHFIADVGFGLTGFVEQVVVVICQGTLSDNALSRFSGDTEVLGSFTTIVQATSQKGSTG